MKIDTIKNNIIRLISEETDESVLLAAKKILGDSTPRNIYEQRGLRAEEIRRLTDNHICK